MKNHPPEQQPIAPFLSASMSFLHEVTQARLRHFFRISEQLEFPSLQFQPDASPMARFVGQHALSIEEFLLLTIALTPHIQPNFFGNIIAGFLPSGGELPEFGGVKTDHSRGMAPTGETVLFILAGMDLAERLRCTHLFESSHLFQKEKIIQIEQVPDGEPIWSGRLIMPLEWVHWFTRGVRPAPQLSFRFPALHLSTGLSWSDLVLNDLARHQLEEISIWTRHQHTLMQEWGMQQRLKPGYRALFYGPPGTGKTLAATLLGKFTGRDVFRIDLSTLVSKYIGETEKNLANLFELAENKDWILFFDEADALFGKRTQVRDAHDKYANQEVSYLLQRIETFDGLAILASNFRSNMDDAFIRRFQSVVYFPMPNAHEREILWQNTLPPQIQLGEKVDLRQIAATYELTGAQISNIVQHLCLVMLDQNAFVLTPELLVGSIRRELAKEGKIVN